MTVHSVTFPKGSALSEPIDFRAAIPKNYVTSTAISGGPNLYFWASPDGENYNRVDMTVVNFELDRTHVFSQHNADFSSYLAGQFAKFEMSSEQTAERVWHATSLPSAQSGIPDVVTRAAIFDADTLSTIVDCRDGIPVSFSVPENFSGEPKAYLRLSPDGQFPSSDVYTRELAYLGSKPGGMWPVWIDLIPGAENNFNVGGDVSPYISGSFLQFRIVTKQSFRCEFNVTIRPF